MKTKKRHKPPKLYDYQERGVVKIGEKFQGRGLLADEPGLGKTIQALTVWKRYFPKETVVVICPASVKYVWEDEAQKHYGIKPVVLVGTRPHEDFEAPSRAKLFVLNYDILFPRITGSPGWLEFLKKTNPGLVILDESHYLKDPKAKRSKAVRELCKAVPHIIALSGTPLTNRPAELFPVINLLRPDVFPSFFQFALAHCSPKRTPYGGWDFRGASRLTLLHRRLRSSLMVRRRKIDVLEDLPPKARFVIPLEIEDRRKYDLAASSTSLWFQKNPKAGDIKWQSNRLTRLGDLKLLAARLKLRSVLSWVEDWLEGSEGKIIVFGVHHEIVESIHDYFKDQSVLVYGPTPQDKRKERFERFLNDGGCRLLVGNIQAAGTGWSARGVSTVAFAELDWVPGNHVQAEDRCHGINRGEKGIAAQAYYLVAKDTVETSLARMLQAKARILSETLDGARQKDDLSILDQLTKELTKGRR